MGVHPHEAAEEGVTDPADLLELAANPRVVGIGRAKELSFTGNYLDAETAWSYSTGSGVVVAVIDTGVSSGPYDGIGTLVSGYDFVNNDSHADSFTI